MSRLSLFVLTALLLICCRSQPAGGPNAPAAKEKERVFGGCEEPREPSRFPAVRLELFAQGLNAPVFLTTAGDGSGRLFVVEQAGRVVVFSGRGSHDVFLDIAGRVESGGEMGLLSVAFHPAFSENRRFFVNYTTRKEGGLFTHVSEFQATEDLKEGLPGSEKVLLAIEQPYANHNGGLVMFGPDGYLYAGMGDGGSANDPHDMGQRLDTLLGKMLRLDVDRKEGGKAYAVPPDNPFVKEPGARPEIYAYGLRNPWRFSFDPVTKRLFVADVGQNDREEINVVEAGKNYGWRVMEGSICTPGVNPDCDTEGLELPIVDYGRGEGTTVVGGYVYRGAEIPDLCGVYLYGDFGSGKIWGLRYDGEQVTAQQELMDTDLLISSFGEDEEGNLYVLDLRGNVYRLAGDESAAPQKSAP